MKAGLIAFVLAAALAATGCGVISDGSIDDLLATPNRQPVLKARSSAQFDARAIFNAAAPSVVTVISVLDDDRIADGIGTGFVFDNKGHIVTNTHVVADLFSHTKAAEVYVRFDSGDRVEAEIVGTDVHGDIALLHVDPQALDGRPPLQLGNTKKVAVGDPVAAIGSPLGESQSLSTGTVSAVGRSIPGLAGFTIPNAIQTDAAVTLGNSGGPLLNADGDVIGVNEQIASIGGGGEGLAFAVPAESIARSVKMLRVSGRGEYAYLGLRTRLVYPELAKRFELPVKGAVYVTGVRNDSPAKLAGFRAGNHTVQFQGSEIETGGDIITAVGGHRLRRNETLAEVLLRFKPFKSVRIDFIRLGRRMHKFVQLGRRPLIWPDPLAY